MDERKKLIKEIADTLEAAGHEIIERSPTSFTIRIEITDELREKMRAPSGAGAFHEYVDERLENMKEGSWQRD